MLKDLIAILRGDGDGTELGAEFLEMLSIAEVMFREVNVALWGDSFSETLKVTTYERDVRINKLERKSRKKVLSHLAASASDMRDIPYCFVLINVVKDAERIGDYVKNIVELEELGTMPEGDIKAELREVGRAAESMLERAGPVFQEGDAAAAERLVRTGRELGKRADALVPRIANAGYAGPATSQMVLLARFYKRIASHTTNILSSVIMPLHKIDYFDEDELPFA